MTFTYEDVIPSLIENATMQKVFINGVHKVYQIAPVENYVLHDSRLDVDIDIDGNIIDPAIEGFTSSTVTVAASYDFTANPNNIYAVLRSTVPEDQIFGGCNNTQVMTAKERAV